MRCKPDGTILVSQFLAAMPSGGMWGIYKVSWQGANNGALEELLAKLRVAIMEVDVDDDAPKRVVSYAVRACKNSVATTKANSVAATNAHLRVVPW